jgi:hypothetical protein
LANPLRNVILNNNSKELNDDKTYRILFWTKYFSSNDWLKFSLKDLKCQYSNCILTEERNNFNISDAVVFHWRDINADDLPLYNSTLQKWVLFNLESPNYTPIDQILPLIKHIDWTMTYRMDSDIYTPYGRIKKCVKNKWKPKYKFRNKKKSIAWIVSHCQTSSQRENYVNKLRKYIDIDVYGSCGNLTCIRDSDCYFLIEQNYKFYLSFENSVSKRINGKFIINFYVSINLFLIYSYAKTMSLKSCSNIFAMT